MQELVDTIQLVAILFATTHITLKSAFKLKTMQLH